MISVRSFHCPISEHRTDARSGILIYPLPDADLFLRDRIARELRKIGIQTSNFTITDPTSVLPWCKSAGIQPVETDSLAVFWTYKTDPESCIEIIRSIVDQHLESDRNDQMDFALAAIIGGN